MGAILKVFGCALQIAFGLLSLVQLYAAALGLSDWLGSVFAAIVIVLSLFLGSGLAILVGAFLGAYNVWEWHWLPSMLFAAPMLLFIVPAVASHLLASLFKRR